MNMNEKASRPALPEGLKDFDLAEPKYWLKKKKKDRDREMKDRDYKSDFDLWYAGDFGWVIPTLTIRNVPRGDQRHLQQRTYAVRISDGAVVRVGFGPHVTHQVHVYGRVSRADALKKYIDLRTKGEADAGQVRDRISTRRAQTALRRGSQLGWML
jgi:hypothetical protein